MRMARVLENKAESGWLKMMSLRYTEAIVLSTMVAGTLLQIVVCVDRHFAITQPLQYHHLNHRRRAVKFSGLQQQ